MIFMNQSYKIVAAAAFSALLLSSTGSRAQTGSYVPAYQQEQSNWCWAACGQMIYWAYKPGSISQCNFVAVSRDKENSEWFDCDNLSSSTASPCTSPGTFNSPQSLYTCGGSIENVLDHYGISSTGYGNAFSTTDLTNATHARKHLVARWGWNSGGGHFVVIYRYSGGNVSFNNPAYGSSYTWSYNSFKTSNGSATWTHTLRMDNSAVYGSVYARRTNPGATEKEPLDADLTEVNFYPNPASARVNFLLPAGSSRLGIYNMLGQLQQELRIADGATTVQLDVSSWPKGVYVLQVDGKGQSRKLMVE